MKRHIITINGLPGSGKSSTAKKVAAQLGYNHRSSGDIFRQMAAERGLSIEEMNATAETQEELDHELDERLRQMGRDEDNFVIDSRTAFHWMPNSFKVFLNLDLETAAERTYDQIQKEGRESQNGSSLNDVLQKTRDRLESEKKRYTNLYNINPFDTSNYDLVIDTKENNLEEVVTIVLNAYTEWLKA